MAEVMENPELRQEYEQRKERTAALTDLTLQSTDGSVLQPTPTQEENDLLALGLMHPDDKVQSPQDKVMPSVAAQQAYMLDGTALPSAPSAPPPAATTTRTTSTPRTTASNGGTISSTGTASSG